MQWHVKYYATLSQATFDSYYEDNGKSIPPELANHFSIWYMERGDNVLIGESAMAKTYIETIGIDNFKNLNLDYLPSGAYTIAIQASISKTRNNPVSKDLELAFRVHYGLVGSVYDDYWQGLLPDYASSVLMSCNCDGLSRDELDFFLDAIDRAFIMYATVEVENTGQGIAQDVKVVPPAGWERLSAMPDDLQFELTPIVDMKKYFYLSDEFNVSPKSSETLIFVVDKEFLNKVLIGNFLYEHDPTLIQLKATSISGNMLSNSNSEFFVTWQDTQILNSVLVTRVFIVMLLDLRKDHQDRW